MSSRIIIFLCALFLCQPQGAGAQHVDNTITDASGAAPNGVYLELGGNGLLYSLNYDRKINDLLSGRIGFMLFEAEGTSTSNGEASRAEVALAVVPAMLNFLIGSGSHRLELGAGILLGAGSAEADNIGSFSGAGFGGVTTTFGYRYQPLGGGFIFRIGLTPYYSGGPQLWGGVSLGYGF